MSTTHQRLWGTHCKIVKKVECTFFFPADHFDRIEYAKWFCDRMNDDPGFHTKVLWSDECIVHLKGAWNTHNMVWWGVERHNIIQHSCAQHELFSKWCFKCFFQRRIRKISQKPLFTAKLMAQRHYKADRSENWITSKFRVVLHRVKISVRSSNGTIGKSRFKRFLFIMAHPVWVARERHRSYWIQDA